MSYTPTTWIDDDGSNTKGTPVSATNMNKIEQGIASVDSHLDQDVKQASTPTFSGVNVGGYENVRATGSLVNKVLVPDPAQIAQAPVASFLWHDILAFNKVATPTFETSTDGTTFTTATLNKALFAHKENQAIMCLDSTSMKAIRWTWVNGGISWSTIQWLILGITYSPTAPTMTVKIEASSDGSTWTTKHLSTGTYNAEPVWFYINGWAGEGHLRVTVTLNSGGNVNLSSIRALTARWGDQGQGSELSFPFSWDGDMNIVMSGTLQLGSGYAMKAVTSPTQPNNPSMGDFWIDTGA